MKTLFSQIDSQEKKRILEMHYSKSKRFILEQDDTEITNDETNDLKSDEEKIDVKIEDPKEIKKDEEPQLKPEWIAMLPDEYDKYKNREGCEIKKGEEISNEKDFLGMEIIQGLYYLNKSIKC